MGKILNSSLGETTKISQYISETGYNEYYVVINSTDKDSTTALDQMSQDLKRVLYKLNLSESNIVSSRLYSSDISNQNSSIVDSDLYAFMINGAASIVQQTPLLSGSYILLAYFLDPILDKTVYEKESMMQCVVKGEKYSQFHTYGITPVIDGDSYKQTVNIFERYNKFINSEEMSLIDNTVRSWIYVRDVDNNYKGMVDARLKYFDEQGLTRDTRYIASTGIEAKMSCEDVLGSMDVLSISGISQEQIIRMEAPSHMSPTIDYGVTFERGTEIKFGDRSHYYVSGTASIDNFGDVLFVGDHERQTERAIMNIMAMIERSKCTINDFMYIIVYLRDFKFTEVVMNVVSRYFTNTPIVCVVGAVCRPSWLVEIEGVLIKHDVNNDFEVYK